MTEYEKAVRHNTTVQTIKNSLEAGTASHKDLSRLASIVGRLAGACMAEQLREEYPNGQISEEDVRRIISPIMRRNHEFVTEMSALLQNSRYKKAGVGLKAVPPEYSTKREDELVKEISRRSFEDGFFG